jgi:transcriptional regulator with XRE-family HTH domain
MPRSSPTVRRRRLGIELRRLRDEADLTIERVALQLECSDSKISRIENAQVRANTRDVRDMLELYGVEGTLREELLQIARDARKKGWWHNYPDLPIVPLAGLEAATHAMSMYAALLVPGLLQTEDYARSVLSALRPDLSSGEIERRVEFRMNRQSILTDLTDQDPPELWIVLDEAALRRRVGGDITMRSQLDHLIELGDLPKVTMQVMPFSTGEHAGMDGSFLIIRFPEIADPDVVYLEHPTADIYLEEPDNIHRFALLFNHLQVTALDPTDSMAFITALAKEFAEGQETAKGS